jgi:hypothetical protein
MQISWSKCMYCDAKWESAIQGVFVVRLRPTASDSKPHELDMSINPANPSMNMNRVRLGVVKMIVMANECEIMGVRLV